MRRRRDRGFTLIELGVVVVIVGILAVLATVGYRKWVTSSRMTEAHNMLENIRSAEEAFKSENGGYLPVSLSYAGAGTAKPTGDYPAATPGPFKTQWGAACATSICVQANSWKKLGVTTDSPVTYGYAVVATNDPGATASDILVNNKNYSAGFASRPSA